MSRKKRYIILTLTIVFSALVFTACGRRNTLEGYAKKHEDYKTKIAEQFSKQGINGDVSINGNDMIITVDIKSMMKGLKMTDYMKTTLRSSFDQSFKYVAGDLATGVKEIQNETEVDGVKLIIKVVNRKADIGEFTFDENSKSEQPQKDSSQKENKKSEKK